MHRFTLSLCLVLSLTCAAFAAIPASFSSSSIEWKLPAGTDQRIDLTIANPAGEVILFKSCTATPSVALADLGENPADGRYAYELRVTPIAGGDEIEAAKRARATGEQTRRGTRSRIVQSGTFAIANGVFVTPAVESRPVLQPVANDYVIADDLIVQSNICVGGDCVNGESFGYDSVRIKENNTRIKFEDTSVNAGYATTDWQLTANDSAAGGADKFSIDDVTAGTVPFTVSGGAPTDSLFIDDVGRVGIGTHLPVLDLHISAGDTPALRFEQPDVGWGEQTWDVAANETNFFVRDITSGSHLPFRIRPGAPTSSIDVSAEGRVGVGNSAPEVMLHLKRSGAQFITVQDTAATPHFTWIYNGGASDHSAIGWDTASAMRLGTSTSVAGAGFSEKMRVTSGGSVGIGTSSPSSRLHVSGGDIRVSSGSFIDDGVTLTAPDYVFDPSYALMPIEELAKFVREEKHLPNVPTSSDIRAQGLNMSQFQMRLLEKVEELTLYVIAQQERIAALEKELVEK